MRTTLTAALLGAACAMPPALADELALNTTTQDRALVEFAQSPRSWNGVATTPDGRIFVCYTQAEGHGIQVGELKHGQATPYPDATWNSPSHDPATGFVTVNALRTGTDGGLWIIDGGAPGFGKASVPGGPRLIRIDLATNTVSRIYRLAGALKPTSFLDDVRFHGHVAYITDAGAPGLLVVDLDTGASRRVLDDDPATTGTPLLADGRTLRQPDGRPSILHADQLEVSPDGRTLYEQPASGPLVAIPTALLDDPNTTPDALRQSVRPYFPTHTTGGTAIDSRGTIYVSDPEHRAIYAIDPDRHTRLIVSDERLVWPDALWIDRQGWLWVPAPQINRAKDNNGGVDAIEHPVGLYRIRIDRLPSPIDHR